MSRHAAVPTAIALVLMTGVVVGQVKVTRLDDRCRVDVDGELFSEYRFVGFPVPILYPVRGPSGWSATRSWPIAEGQNDARDHPHHRSLWFAHGEVDGHDFWAGQGQRPRIEHEELLAVESGPTGSIRTRNRWVVGDAELVCRDERTLHFGSGPGIRTVDWDVTLIAAERQVHFGDTKEGTMAIRMAPPLRLQGKVAAGEVVNSEGVTGKAVWGKRARWIDYHGPIDGETVGIAMFDHPGNHGHPCRWHAREYGLLAANPFGVHHFEGKPKGTGGYVLAKGAKLRLRYRFLFHDGALTAEELERLWRGWTAAPAPKERSKERRGDER